MQIDTQVRTLLEARRGDWQRIAAEADVSHSWISQFVRGLIPKFARWSTPAARAPPT